MARTEKDAAFQATSKAERDMRLASALQYYNEAYLKTGGYWVGINVATLRTLLDQEAEAKEIAQRVYQDAELELLGQASKPSTDRYWILATLGEAAMNLQNWVQPSVVSHYGMDKPVRLAEPSMLFRAGIRTESKWRRWTFPRSRKLS